MADIGELIVRIKADAAQLEREMQKANGIVRQNTGAMSAAFRGLKAELLSLVPAISALALVGFARHAFAAADRINDLALRTGLAGSTLSALEVPLKQSGSSVEDLSQAMIRLNNALGEAVESKEAARNFQALGLSVADLLAQSPDQRLYSVARAIHGLGDESAQTNGLLAVMGRGSGTLLPTFKELGDQMEETVKKQKQLGKAITDAELKKIDEFGDAMTDNLHHAELVAIRFLETLNDIGARMAQIYYDRDLPTLASGATVSHVRPNVPTDKELARGITDKLGIANEDEELEKKRKKQAAEAAIAAARARAAAEELAKSQKAGREELEKYNLALQRQNTILHESPREQSALEAMYKTMDLTQKAGIHNADALIEKNKNLARTNYDLVESMQEAARFQQELHDKLSSTLTDIAFRADSAREAMLGFAQSIARAAFEKRVAGPLADAFIGSGGNKGFLDDAIGGIGSLFGGFFAEGGSPPVGVPSIVGERGPEIFVPHSAGTILPSGVGGTTVIVQQTIHMSPGLPETVGAAVRAAAPGIAAQAQAAVFAELQRGGAGSRIAGLRN